MIIEFPTTNPFVDFYRFPIQSTNFIDCYRMLSIIDFINCPGRVNAVSSLQSNAENADRSRETTYSDKFTSVESEINSRFQIPRRWAGEVLPSTASRIVPPSDFNPRQNCSLVQTCGRRYPGGKHDSRCFLM